MLAALLAGCGGVVLLALLSAALAPADPRGAAIVVLGAGGMPDGTPTPASRARVARGVALWKAGAAPVLIVSDGARVAPAMAVQARALGVPASALRVDSKAASTLQNALNVRRLLETGPPGPVVLVSEGIHMARARASFAWAGVTVSGYAHSSVFRPGPGPAVAMILRETLAWPYNIARVLGWHAAGVLGVPEARRMRWLT
ncbi:YdcF family protein [Oceanibium sediminis]|uniref:YdcF family protein n=1 Tax=Oceanibium sediminis TaxID=2026339 RepID=UPI0013003837|nr:YdcF family protein [Oceanibium sediminis]